MPVYMFQQAEVRAESREEVERKERQLIEELDACQITDKTAINKLKCFLTESDVWHISEMDYPLRMQYEQYLIKSKTAQTSIRRHINTYDQVKRCWIAEQMQSLAGQQKYGWKYRNSVLYLKYHSNVRVAKEFEAVRQQDALVWDFRKNCSEILKRQIFSCMNRIIETVSNLKTRKNRMLALKSFYNFCADQRIQDVSLIELKHLWLFQKVLDKQGAQAKASYMSIVNFCRKNAFVESEKIMWNATVWYIDRFHLTKDRVNESASLESISFMEIRQTQNREILQSYMKYEIGVTGQALSTIVRRFMAVRNFLEFLEDKDLLAVECTALEIEEYAQKLQERQIQAKGYKERLSGIGHFFKFLEVRKYIKKVPFRLEYYMQKVVRIHHDRSVDYDVYMEILRKLYRFSERLRCMFLHLWCVGLRASEVCVLKGNAYYRQGKDRWIQVYQVKMKTYKRVPIPEGLYQIMEVYLTKYQIQPDDYIFQDTKGGPCRYDTFRCQMLKACAENEIENGNYIFKSHDYRHTVATMFFDNEVSIQSIRDYLGHTYEEMTRQYIDYMPQRIAEANEEFFTEGESLASCLKKGDSDAGRQNLL